VRDCTDLFSFSMQSFKSFLLAIELLFSLNHVAELNFLKGKNHTCVKKLLEQGNRTQQKDLEPQTGERSTSGFVSHYRSLLCSKSS